MEKQGSRVTSNDAENDTGNQAHYILHLEEYTVVYQLLKCYDLLSRTRVQKLGHLMKCAFITENNTIWGCLSYYQMEISWLYKHLIGFLL